MSRFQGLKCPIVLRGFPVQKVGTEWVPRVQIYLHNKTIASKQIGSCRSNAVHRHNACHFRPSCVCLVCFLRKSTELHDMLTECQRIIIHFLLLISHKLPVNAREVLPSSIFTPWSLPDRSWSNHASVHPMLQFTPWFNLLSNFWWSLSVWRCRLVFLSLDFLSYSIELIPYLRDWTV